LEASPKAISERTSYIRVRLAFHPYPHLIPVFFSIRGFGPPVSVTCPSPWTWVDHTVSAVRPHTLCAQLRLAFASAPRFCHLTSHTIVTRRSILQKVRRHPLTGSDYL